MSKRDKNCCKKKDPCKHFDCITARRIGTDRLDAQVVRAECIETENLQATNLEVTGSIIIPGLCLPTEIRSLPFAITESGTYILCSNLNWDQTTPAIDVAARDVTINLNSHSITTTANTTALIRLMVNSNNFEIANGSLIAVAPSTATRGLANIGPVHTIKVHNVTFDGLRDGMSDSVTARQPIDNLVVQGSSFVNITRFAILLNHSVTNFILERTQFLNIQGVATILIEADRDTVSNVLVDSSQFYAAAGPLESHIQIGGFDLIGAQSSNVIIRNSNFDISRVTGSDDPLFPPTAIRLFNGNTPVTVGTNSVIIENNTFNLSDTSLSGIMVGDLLIGLTFPSHSTVIRGNTFDSTTSEGFTAATAIALLNGSAARVEKNLIRNTLTAGILVRGAFSFAHILENSIVTGRGAGILVEAGARGTNISNNIINDHCGAGINLLFGTTDNLVEQNRVYLNGAGILDGGSNVIEDNIIFSNNKFCEENGALVERLAAIQKQLTRTEGTIKKSKLDDDE